MKGKRVKNKSQRVKKRKGKKIGQKSDTSSRQPARDLNLDFPKEFRLSENFSGIIEVIMKLRQLLEQQGARPPRICFSNIAAIDIAAALMLGAEVQAWTLNNPNAHPHFYNKSWNPEVQSLLTAMKLFPLLDAPRRGKPKHAHTTGSTFMPVISGSNVDMSKFIVLREGIESEIKGPMSTSQYFFIGLSEAVTNAIQHAYGSDQRKQWWASASYNKSAQELRIVCYDRGRTIPKTLPTSGLWEQVRNVMSRFRLSDAIDCDLIEGALRTRRTMTKKRHRGQGLPQLMKFVDQADQGWLRIYSRNGMVLYTKSESEGEGNYEKEQLIKQVKGTLIEWSISVHAEKI